MRVIALLFVFYSFSGLAQTNKISYWLTRSDRSVLFTQQTNALTFSPGTTKLPTIAVDETKKYQTIDGFGYALTGGSAQHMVRMSSAARTALIKELFSTDANNIGV